MAIASDIRPGDDPVQVSEKLVGRRRTQLMRELFAYFGFPEDVFRYFFGTLYTRDVLPQRERELCAVAALCVLSRPDQLRTHVIAALRAGATQKEVAEVILQMSTYGGMPVCMEGLAICREVFERSGLGGGLTPGSSDSSGVSTGLGRQVRAGETPVRRSSLGKQWEIRRGVSGRGSESHPKRPNARDS